MRWLKIDDLRNSKVFVIKTPFDLDISFKPLSREDFPLIQKWLAEPHVKEWWHDDLNAEEIETKYGPRVDGHEPTHIYIILHETKPIGIIQWYLWADYPAHAAQLGAESASAGMDLAIGETENVGKGIGSAVIQEFVKKIIFEESAATSVVTDPEELNSRSLRAFEKAGFVLVGKTKLKGENFERRIVELKKITFKSRQFVITGCPGSGKTTLINQLRKMGFVCIDEPARQILAEQRRIGGNALPEEDALGFTKLLWENSLSTYRKGVGSVDPIIYDRGLPDVIAYAKLFELDTADLEIESKKYSYNRTVLIAPPWKEIYKTDDERKMTFEQAVQFHEMFRQSYLNLGYELIELPFDSAERRAQFVARLVQERQ